MASTTSLVHLNMSGNEIQNVVAQNLSAVPTTNVKAGRFYFNTTDNTLYVYNGTAWMNALGQGSTYTFSTGLTESSGTVTLNAATTSALGGVIVGSNISVNAGTISVADASTSAKGVIEIATDSEASTGTSETLAVNPKQLATAVSGLIDLTDLSIASGSSNYLGYDNTTGQISANVDTTVGTVSTNLVTSGAVQTAINNAISNVYKAQGSVAFASLPTLSSSIEGYVYNVSDSFTTTSDFVEGSGVTYPAGTNVVCINTSGTTYKWDVLAGTIDTSAFLTASSTNTLTNKTIDADDNTISDLTTSNFKSGTIVTSLTNSNTVIPTAKAVEGALRSMSYAFYNPALTAYGGEATWSLVAFNGGGDRPIFNVDVYEVATGNKVEVAINVSLESISYFFDIGFNTQSNIAANTYVAIITAAYGTSIS